MACPPEFTPGTLVSEVQARRWLRSCGRGVEIYRGCRIIPPDRVTVGDYCRIDEGVRIFAGLGVMLGAHVHLAFGSSISGGGVCTLGDFAGLGAGVRLITGTENADGSGLTNPTVPADWRSVRRGQVTIGAHALVFTNSIVFPDVTIGEGAIVAAGSVVHHDLKPWGIYCGWPLVQVGVRASDTVRRQATELLQSEATRTR